MKLQKTIENAEKTSKAGKAKCFYVLLSTYIYNSIQFNSKTLYL